MNPWSRIVVSTFVAASLAATVSARAHCDGMDGPVVKAAQQALAENDVNLVLIWISATNETEIKHAFEKTIAVRKLGIEARELADRYFFETLVRLHQAGEGVAYSGLKPAGRDLGPAIPAADKAIATGDIKALRGMLSEEVGSGLQSRFREALTHKKFEKNDLKAGREFVHAYVEYVHYVEGVHQAARGVTSPHAGESTRLEKNSEKLVVKQ